MLRRAGVPALAALLLLTGCANSSASSVVPSNASVGPAAPQAGGVELSITVADGTVTPAPANVAVPLGATVSMTVTSDAADELHVHGYDLEKQVPAGGTVTVEFTADQPGTFEVETHESGLLLTKLVVS